MSRTFAYVRVSTAGQTAENQSLEIAAAGFAVEPHRVVSETVSGSEAIARRAGFSRLLDRMEPGDVLVVTRLDRLGRDAIDVSATVARLAGMGVRVHCLALGGVDLTSSAGRMTMGVINAVAQFERDLLVERTQSGLARARAQGKRLGRPHALDPTARAAVLEGLGRGESLSSLARRHGTSRQTVMRLRDAVQGKAGEVPQQPRRSRARQAQTRDPTHAGVQVDEDRQRHPQGLRGDAGAQEGPGGTELVPAGETAWRLG